MLHPAQRIARTWTRAPSLRSPGVAAPALPALNPRCSLLACDVGAIFPISEPPPQGASSPQLRDACSDSYLSLVSGPEFRGGYLTFDGANDYGVGNVSAINNQSSTTILFRARFRATQNNSVRVVEKGANSEWTVSINETASANQKLTFTPRNRHISDDALTTTTDCFDEQWRDFACVIDAGAPFHGLYVNGILEDSASTAGVIASNDTTDLYIARYGGGNYYGAFDLAYLYILNRPLSADEILSVHKTPYGPFLPSLQPRFGSAGGPTSVTISPALISGSGSLAGLASVSVSKLAAAIAATGAVSGSAAVSVAQQAAAISGAGAVHGQPQISVLAAGSPISGIGSVEGSPAVSVSVQATVISATGQVLGAVQIGQSGNVDISAAPISAAGSLAGQHVIDVYTSGVIAATGGVEGTGTTGLVLVADPISGTGSLSGAPTVSASVSGPAITGTGAVSGQVVRNVLVAADALVAAGSLSGVVQIVGAGVLGDVTDPFVIKATPVHLVIKVTPTKTTFN